MQRSHWTSSEDAALQQLVDEGTIGLEQAAAVRAALVAAGPAPAATRQRVAEILGYLGAGLVLGGIVLLVSTSWDQLSRAGRVGLLSVVALLLLASGLAIGGGPRGVRRLRRGAEPVRARIVGTLFGLTAAAAGIAAGVGFEAHGMLVGTATALVVGAAGYVAVPTLPGLLATALASFLGVFAVMDEIGITPLRLAAALVPLGLAWATLAAVRLLPQRTAGLAVGAAIALIGAQQPLGEPDAAGWAYGGTLAIALAFLAYYLADRTIVLLLAGVVGVTLAVPEAVWDWTDGRVNGAALVLLAGAVLLATGGLGLRMHRPDRTTRATSGLPADRRP